jgi:hypothetical protein
MTLEPIASNLDQLSNYRSKQLVRFYRASPGKKRLAIIDEKPAQNMNRRDSEIWSLLWIDSQRRSLRKSHCTGGIPCLACAESSRNETAVQVCQFASLRVEAARYDQAVL